MISLSKEINLNAKLGKNSYYDDGKALIIENIVALAPGSFVGEDGTMVNIGQEAVKNTKWRELLLGRPIVEGHEQVNSESYPHLIRGVVKGIRSNSKVIVF